MEDCNYDPHKLWRDAPDVKLVCGALGHYLRGLTDPLFKFELYQDWLDATSIEKVSAA